MRVGQLDRHGYLFGQKLTASMSPLLHEIVYRELGLEWEQIRLDSTDMSLFLQLIQHPKFYGEPSNVFLFTSPPYAAPRVARLTTHLRGFGYHAS